MLGRDIVFSCRDNALFLCRDDVAIEVSLSRPRRPRQEVRCCTLRVATGLVLAGISLSRQRISMSQQSLVKARSFYVATENFCITTEFGLGQGSYVTTK